MIRKSSIGSVYVIIVALFASASASAETLEQVLSLAYAKNADINAQRAAVRAADENVAGANAGFQPRVSLSGTAGGNQVYYTAPNYALSGTQQLVPRSYGLTIVQNLYNGDQTSNQVKIANSGVLGARAELESTESLVFLDAITKYVDVIRDASVARLMKNNLDVLTEQLRETQVRYDVGDINNTGLAQVKAQLAAAEADLNNAETNLTISRASFAKIVGTEPADLKPIDTPLKKLPHSLDEAVAQSLKNNPKIQSLAYNESVAELNIQLAEGALKPSVDIVGSASQQWDYQFQNDQMNDLSLLGKVTVPLYEGGEANAHTRRAKELLGQRQLESEALRASLRSQVTAAWEQFRNTEARIKSATTQIESAKIASTSVRSEFQVGQSTTLDVLISVQNELSAELNLATAKHDQIVSAYQVLALTGKLSAAEFGIKTKGFDAEAHYNATQKRIFGTDIK
jgi:outer membrane protein